ncbi:MAG: T9SS type A sorting domain-containing protein [bacterium]|nr:T9SS type A sorting domain-containing protein [bacterium]
MYKLLFSCVLFLWTGICYSLEDNITGWYVGNTEVHIVVDFVTADSCVLYRGSDHMGTFSENLIYRDKGLTKNTPYTYTAYFYEDTSMSTKVVNITTGQVKGWIEYPTIWRTTESPFYVEEGGITISGDSGKLTIEQGVKVFFRDTFGSIMVQKGLLEVAGTQGAPVFFGPETPTSYFNGIFIWGDETDHSEISMQWAEIRRGYWGIHLEKTFSSNVSNTSITNCYYSGIVCSDGVPTISNCFIADNLVGIHCTSNSAPIISQCEIVNNALSGIQSGGGATPVANGNNFACSDSFAINNTDPSVTISAQNCWWGNTTGPVHSGNKYAKLGEKVSDYVNYQNFKKDAPYNVSTASIDLRIDSIKVMQATDDMEMIQAGKGATVRLFINIGRCKEVEDVIAHLDFNGQYFSSAFDVNSDGPKTIKCSQSWGARELLDGQNAINFYIPYRLVNEGTLSINAEVDHLNSIAERDEDNNEVDTSGTIKPVPPQWIVYYYGLRGGAWSFPGSGPTEEEIKEFSMKNHSFLESTYPCRFLAIHQGWSAPGAAGITVSAMAYLKSKLLLTYGNALAVGIVPADYMPEHGLSAGGIYRYTALVTYRDYKDDQWCAAHELSHSFDILDEYYDIDNPETLPWKELEKRYPSGYMASNGWWTEKKGGGCIYNICPKDSASGANVYSFMGNNANIKHWIPKVDFDALYTKLCVTKKSQVDRRLLVNLILYANDSTVAMPFYELPSGNPDIGTQGDYELQCLNATSSVLASMKFDADFSEIDTSCGLGVFYVCVGLEYPVNTARIVLKHGAQNIFQRILSPSFPTVKLLSPTGGGIQDSIVVAWSADDPDGDTLAYAVLYKGSSDAGWIPLVSDLKDTSYTVDANWLNSDSASFKIIATDGINSTEDSSDAASGIANRFPSLSISKPSDSSSFAHTQEIMLSGSAYDQEDGTLPESCLVWVSSIDDTLGRGSSIKSTLSLGAHQIYFSGVDNNDAEKTDTITLFVIADTLPDLFIAEQDISAPDTVGILDTCYIRATIHNGIRDVNCIGTIYINLCDSAHELKSEAISIEANSTAQILTLWTPTVSVKDTIIVKITETDLPETDTTNNIAKKTIYVRTIGEDSDQRVPKVFFLSQNYPNPALSSTNIQFGIPSAGAVSLTVYDITGRTVKNLVANKEYKPGYYTIVWDRCDNRGEKVSSGVYFIRLNKDNNRLTRKTVLLK